MEATNCKLELYIKFYEKDLHRAWRAILHHFRVTVNSQDNKKGYKLKQKTMISQTAAR